MKKIDFVKMTGAGNDFILVDARAGRLGIVWHEFAPVVCDRRYGVGADGLLVIEKTSGRPVKMNYYNADGSSGGMCGNGGRCVARYMMEGKRSRSTEFEAFGHLYKARRTGESISLYMKGPAVISTNIVLPIFEEKVSAHFVDSGAPHAIVFMRDLAKSVQRKLAGNGINDVGRKIRRHRRFSPDGTNVDFVELLDGSTISMRTYERGVESETLACGTGAVASAVACSLRFGLQSPIDVKTRSGEKLRVSFDKQGGAFSDVELTGSAKVVYRGRLNYDNGKKKLLE